MYLYGIIILIIERLIIKNYIINLVITIILCFLANNLYIDFAKKKIRKILNTETDKNIIIQKCEKKGGTSKMIYVIFLLFIAVLGLSILYKKYQ